MKKLSYLFTGLLSLLWIFLAGFTNVEVNHDPDIPLDIRTSSFDDSGECGAEEY